jgi:hypothetical protein
VQRGIEQRRMQAERGGDVVLLLRQGDVGEDRLAVAPDPAQPLEGGAVVVAPRGEDGVGVAGRNLDGAGRRPRPEPVRLGLQRRRGEVAACVPGPGLAAACLRVVGFGSGVDGDGTPAGPTTTWRWISRPVANGASSTSSSR